MKTIIAGSRHITDMQAVRLAVADCGWTITEVVSGCAPGVDRLGEEIAVKMDLPIKFFPAHWGKFGKAAGPLRNQQMAEYAEALIAVWDGKSTGTADMIRRAKERSLVVYVRIFRFR